jgi:hypothetical protein
MTSFDPAAVRQAVAEFTPRWPQKFPELSPAREVIVERQKKRGANRAIGVMPAQHHLLISQVAIAAYCREGLTEIVRSRRRSNGTNSLVQAACGWASNRF